MKRHNWSLGAFDDGSGVWICEWRDEYVYREHRPSKTQASTWFVDDSRPECRGYSKQADGHISRELAKLILMAWANSRKDKNGGWVDL